MGSLAVDHKLDLCLQRAEGREGRSVSTLTEASHDNGARSDTEVDRMLSYHHRPPDVRVCVCECTNVCVCVCVRCMCVCACLFYPCMCECKRDCMHTRRRAHIPINTQTNNTGAHECKHVQKRTKSQTRYTNTQHGTSMHRFWAGKRSGLIA